MRGIFFATAFVFAAVSTALSGATDPMAAVRQLRGRLQQR